MKVVSSPAGVLLVLFILNAVYPSGMWAQDRFQTDETSRRPMPYKQPAVAEPELESLGDPVPDWQARWELARLLSYVKRYEASIAAYRKVLAEKPELFEARLEMARVFEWSGRRRMAREALEKVPQAHLDDQALRFLADAYAFGKDYDRAVAAYRRLLERRPEDARVRFRLAEVLSWQKKYELSLLEYRKVVKALPEDVQVRRKYAFVLSWAGYREEAIAELKKTLNE